ncbi:hypothetical protein [Verrucomicrobium sp. BvORR034]|uniref:hypothetical protein n=1 Tax=Verrucomicrobium sp. BvORR034 TaxID=1396418 RepID=UPI000679E202|nr:hypothetical protein [Verrucomicrobium sp. BvORR034]
MKTLLFLTSWVTLAISPLSHADDLLDKCTSHVWRAGTDIGALLREASKNKREDCVQALLSNANFNVRSDALRASFLLEPNDQISILRSSLRKSSVWTPPTKIGEKIATFDILTEKYIELFQRNGVKATKAQLTSEQGRAELLKALGDQAGS